MIKRGNKSVVRRSRLMSGLEFGRVLHAEMNAITDAARIGVSVADCTLYVTTFPCHNCTKHIVGSGIKRVVFIEPYPKSLALELHSDSVYLGTHYKEGMVQFTPFIGISPRIYRPFFERETRKKSGSIQDWINQQPDPTPIVGSRRYIEAEQEGIVELQAQYNELNPSTD